MAREANVSPISVGLLPISRHYVQNGAAFGGGKAWRPANPGQQLAQRDLRRAVRVPVGPAQLRQPQHAILRGDLPGRPCHHCRTLVPAFLVQRTIPRTLTFFGTFALQDSTELIWMDLLGKYL